MPLLSSFAASLRYAAIAAFRTASCRRQPPDTDISIAALCLHIDLFSYVT